MLEYKGFEIHWEGHATVRIEDNGFTALVDPFSKVSSEVEADLVLITRNEDGNYDPEFLEKICSENTCVVVPESMEDIDIPCQDIEYVSKQEVIDVFGIEIESVPIYNQETDQPEGSGYRFVMRDTSFYVAGDTGLVEEAYDLEGRVNVAFLPVDGEYNMDVDDAVKMAVRIKSDITVPYHYGVPFFSRKDTDLRGLKAELGDRNLRCEILETK